MKKNVSKEKLKRIAVRVGAISMTGVLSAVGLTIFRPDLARATTALLANIVCPSPDAGMCSATFTGGTLIGSLVFPVTTNPSDSSKLTAGSIGGAAVDLAGAAPVFKGSLEGGPTGAQSDTEIEYNLANENGLGDSGGGGRNGIGVYNIPMGGRPSPLFGAQPFTQKMLLFEEFGIENLTTSTNISQLPLPQACADATNPECSTVLTRSTPNGADLDAFLGTAGLFPFPSRLSNTTAKNPWWNEICRTYLGRANCSAAGPIEGRPPGEGWGHQRWTDFFPAKAFKTAQAGSRTNGGMRNARQMHKYQVGEFAPGGLYNNTAGVPGFNGTTSGIKIKFHPNMPVQHHKSVWTFDGTLPPKLLMVRYGEPVLMRHYNALPIDVSANRGFGLHTITTHEHNGHNPGESDGFAGAFYFPGQYYDYRWPLAIAGHDTINIDASEPKASTPCAAGETIRVARKTGFANVLCDTSRDPNGKAGIIPIRGDYREMMSTHWFHDHMLDFTAQNVYKGNAAMMNYYSAIDRGNESLNDGINLRLPSGSGLPWGNRDYDMNLIVADKAWDAAGQLWYNVFQRDGFLGDQMTVNFRYKPTVDVRARRYRFRILNGAVARYFKIAVVREIAGTSGTLVGPAGSNLSYETVPFHMIANDGNIMEHAVAFDGTLGTQKGILPEQGIGERYDIIIDFAANGITPGSKVFMINLLEYDEGDQANGAIALAKILSGAYKPVAGATSYSGGDPAVGAFLRFDVKSCVNATGGAVACVDPSLNPINFVAGKTKMLVRPTFTASELSQATRRSYRLGLGFSGTDDNPWVLESENVGYSADTRRISAAPNLGSLTDDGKGKVEIWTISSRGLGWDHPVHVHFEEGQILTRNGAAPPEWEKWARKDMFRVGGNAESSQTVEVAYRFREFSGSYVEHCHNTTHEDHAMLLRWDVEKPGQTLLMPSPLPTWDGVSYVDSVAIPTFRTGNNNGGSGPRTGTVTTNGTSAGK